MKLISFILGVLWFLIIAIPSSILMYKLSVYLWTTEFREWWITMIWVLIGIPTITVGIMIKIKNKKGEK